MAKTPKHSTNYPGVRYQEHKTRRHGLHPDRYFLIRYQHNGKRREEGLGWASGGWSAKRAAAKLAEIREAIRTGEGPQSLQEARELNRQEQEAAAERAETEAMAALTFNEFWTTEYLPKARQEKKARSVSAEENWYKNWIAPTVGSKRLIDISEIDIERIKSRMTKAGRAPRSAQYCLAVIRQVFSLAARRGRFRGDNPASKVKVRVGDNKRVRSLSRDEADALLDELKRHSLDVHDMALLSLRTGMRAGEVFSLTWDCIDLDRRTIFIKETKSGRNRYAFMTEDIRRMIEIRRAGTRSTGLVFPGRSGQRITAVSDSFPRAVDALGLNAGIEDPRQKVVFHTLRHTFASWLVQAGEPLYTVQKLLGHGTIAMTERYSHLAPDNMLAAIERMEQRLKAEAPAKVVGIRR